MDINIVNDCVLYIFRKDKFFQRLLKFFVKLSIKIYIKFFVKKLLEELFFFESVVDVKLFIIEILE